MECGLKEKTILYFYGELNKKEAEEMRGHIESCPSCSGELETLKATAVFLDSLREPGLPAQAAVLNYARERVFFSPGFSLLEKVYSFAFSLALVLFFLIPFGAGEKPLYGQELEVKIASAESELSALKYDFMDYPENNFEYKASDINYSDLGNEVL